MRLWEFRADMNFDNMVTISDYWLWFKWLYFYPGDILLFNLVNTAPSFASFFELSVLDLSGGFSGVMSFVFWYVLLSIVARLFFGGDKEAIDEGKMREAQKRLQQQGKEEEFGLLFRISITILKVLIGTGLVLFLTYIYNALN